MPGTIRDRDSKFSFGFDAVLANEGLQKESAAAMDRALGQLDRDE